MGKGRCEMAEHREPTAPSVDRLIARLEAATEGGRYLDVLLAVSTSFGGGNMRKATAQQDAEKLAAFASKFNKKHTPLEYDEEREGYCYWPNKCRVERHWEEDDDTCLADTFYDVPNYTTSLDAALTLLPEGWSWRVGNTPSKAFADLGTQQSLQCIVGATPALALCIGALKARTTDPPTGLVELGERSNTDPQPDTASATPPSPPAVVDYTERAQPLIEKYANYLPTGALEEQFGDDLRDVISAVASEHQAEIARLRKELAEVGDEAGRLAAQYQALSGIIDSLRVADDANAKAALLARLREPEMREAVLRAILAEDWTVPSASSAPTHIYVAEAIADAALAVIREKLT